MSDELVDIVDEKDRVIGKIDRATAHEKQIHHRLVEVWFFNSRGQILVQKRSQQKKILPGLREWTVSGHVDAGETYESALIRETREETGVETSQEDFIDLGVFIPNLERDGKRITHVRRVFGYRYEGAIESLKFDSTEVDSFEWWDIDKLLERISEHDSGFFEFLWHPFSINVLRNIKRLHHD